MALTLVWTKRAIEGFDNIVSAIAKRWSEKEVKDFINESNEFFSLLCQYPELLQKTSRKKNVYRGPMNKLTIITYRVKTRKRQIELINIRSARQKPN